MPFRKRQIPLTSEYNNLLTRGRSAYEFRQTQSYLLQNKATSSSFLPLGHTQTTLAQINAHIRELTKRKFFTYFSEGDTYSHHFVCSATRQIPILVEARPSQQVDRQDQGLVQGGPVVSGRVEGHARGGRGSLEDEAGGNGTKIQSLAHSIPTNPQQT